MTITITITIRRMLINRIIYKLKLGSSVIQLIIIIIIIIVYSYIALHHMVNALSALQYVYIH